ncbi:hypothetical protein [Pseudescherichia sp.]|uniref:hypothetical protein n=1 Tax=Pseudescherichia sp. TaxID=2055881 RepID=UPI002898748C|nr:hypothetical protein [Pseudescherichia sp.]
MKKALIFLGLIASLKLNAAQLENQLNWISIPKTKLCTVNVQLDNETSPHEMKEFVTIIDYGNQFYIIPEPKPDRSSILSPKLGYSEKYGQPSGIADRNGMIFIKGLGARTGIYDLYDPEAKSKIVYLCP